MIWAPVYFSFQCLTDRSRWPFHRLSKFKTESMLFIFLVNVLTSLHAFPIFSCKFFSSFLSTSIFQLFKFTIQGEGSCSWSLVLLPPTMANCTVKWWNPESQSYILIWLKNKLCCPFNVAISKFESVILPNTPTPFPLFYLLSETRRVGGSLVNKFLHPFQLKQLRLWL